MKLKFNGILVLLVVLMAQLTFAQERSVSGVVSDNAGLPIPGVSVLVKGTNSGTQTDFDGKYSIKATSSQQTEWQMALSAPVPRNPCQQRRSPRSCTPAAPPP